MTTYTVTGVFTGRLNDDNSEAILAGTVNITSDTIFAMDLTVSNMPDLHFTEIYFNMFYNGSWLLSGQTPSSCSCVFGAGEEDYLTFTFGPPLGAGFTQAKINNGVVVHNTYFADGGSRTEYFGLGLQGTICPLSGCAAWPLPAPKGVPGPVAGSGLMGLLVLAILLNPKNIARKFISSRAQFRWWISHIRKLST